MLGWMFAGWIWSPLSRHEFVMQGVRFARESVETHGKKISEVGK